MAMQLQSPVYLDDAEDCMDDDYDGCEEKMYQKVKKNLLKKERAKDKRYDDAWRNAEKNVKDGKGLPLLEAQAIYVYSTNRPSVYTPFNCATRDGAVAAQFNYKSLHFLLSMAVKNLNRGQSFTTYRGIKKTTEVKGDQIRFGQFTSTSRSLEVAMGFGVKTIYKITTRHGADIAKYSSYPGEQEVLIPPTEAFEVIRNEPLCKCGKRGCGKCGIQVVVLESRGAVSLNRCSLAASAPANLQSLNVTICKVSAGDFKLYYRSVEASWTSS